MCCQFKTLGVSVGSFVKLAQTMPVAIFSAA